MLRRILLLSLQQALRSVALVLFPTAFLSLTAWATAGSSAGNTTDPIRAALWFWLGSHQVPFHLLLPPTDIPGLLSYLPIGALIFPFLAVRSSFNRLSNEIENVRGARIFFSLFYAGLATGIAFLSMAHGVRPVWFLATAFSLILALLATIDFDAARLHFVKFPAYLISMLWGLGAIAVGISIAAHFSIVKDLTTVTHPGLVGGVLFLLLQVLYLPNLAISAISYASGFGFSLGAGTHISPAHFTLHELPAIPLLGALPTGVHKSITYFSILGLLAALIVVININVMKARFRDRQVSLVKSLLFIGLVVGAISYLASGELVTSAMSPVGVIWWKLPAAILFSIIVFAVLTQYLPLGFRKVRDRA